MAVQFCTFRLDGMLLGVDVQRVQEVIRFQEMTPVPLAPEAIRGLINLRGQIVTALDLRARLGIAPLDPDLEPMNVIVTHQDEAVSLLVDEIGDVVEVGEGHWERAPPTLPAELRGVISGLYKLDSELMLVLDPVSVIDVSGLAA